MKIRVEIERLVLTGIDVGAREAAQIQAAVKRELTRMIAGEEMGREIAASTAVPKIIGPDLDLRKESPGRMGERIAGSVYGGMTGMRRSAVRAGGEGLR
jgi:hypothetical protein